MDTHYTAAHQIIKERIKERWNGEIVWNRNRQGHSQGLDFC